MFSAAGIPKHLRWHNPCGSRSITLPAGAGSCFHPSPCRKKRLIQAIENIFKSNYLPRALPGALPPALLAPLPASRLSPARLFPGAHKELDAGAAWQQLCPLQQRFQPQLPQRARAPISSLGVSGGSPALGSCSPIPPTCCRGALCVCPPPSRALGSSPCSFPPSHRAGSGTGVTGTLRPGCFPINCYFLIPLAVRRAASWLRLLRARAAAGCPPARS